MDPISIVGLIDASIDLALKCASAVKRMNDIASKYKNSELTLRSIAQYLETMQFAWDRIGAWTQSYTPDEDTDEDGFVQRLARFLETGTLVMDALEKELLPFSDETIGFAQKAKLVWNENTFLDHQSRVRDQAMSMNLLLQAIQLPTPKDRGKLIQKSEKQFKKSDESAYSIVPSRMSILTQQTDGQESIRSEEDLVYRRLSFEDDLFTARVYKRNYRNPMLLRLLKMKPRRSSGKIIPQERAKNAHISCSYEDRPDSVVSQDQESMHGGSVQGAHIPSVPIEQCHQAATHDAYRQEVNLDTLVITSELLSIASDVDETSLEDAKEDETLDPRSALLPRRPARQRSVSVNEESSRIFMNACEQGDYNTVERFLKMGHDVHSQQAYPHSPGFKALHAATIYGHIDIVDILLQYGASIEDGTTSIGSRPLHLAAQSGDAGMVQLLLENGAQIGAENQLREQPIHLAAKSGRRTTLRILVDKGATLDCLDQDGRQPLHYAAGTYDQPLIIEILVNAGADVDAWALDERPLNIACRRNLLGNVRALFTLGADIIHYPTHSSPLYTAIKYGSLAALEELLEHRIDPNSLGVCGTPAVHLSVDLGASDLRAAERSLRLLLRYGADVNAQEEDGNTALHKIARPDSRRPHDGQVSLAKILLDNNADRNALNTLGHTPLHVATEGHQHDISTLLIKSGARLLSMRHVDTLRLEFHGSTHDVLCWFSVASDLTFEGDQDLYEEHHVQKLRKVLENLSASGLPVRMVRYDPQAEDDFKLRSQSKYTDSQYVEKVIARTQGLLKRDLKGSDRTS